MDVAAYTPACGFLRAVHGCAMRDQLLPEVLSALGLTQLAAQCSAWDTFELLARPVCLGAVSGCRNFPGYHPAVSYADRARIADPQRQLSDAEVDALLQMLSDGGVHCTVVDICAQEAVPPIGTPMTLWRVTASIDIYGVYGTPPEGDDCTLPPATSMAALTAERDDALKAATALQEERDAAAAKREALSTELGIIERCVGHLTRQVAKGRADLSALRKHDDAEVAAKKAAVKAAVAAALEAAARTYSAVRQDELAVRQDELAGRDAAHAADMANAAVTHRRALERLAADHAKASATALAKAADAHSRAAKKAAREHERALRQADDGRDRAETAAAEAAERVATERVAAEATAHATIEAALRRSAQTHAAELQKALRTAGSRGAAFQEGKAAGKKAAVAEALAEGISQLSVARALTARLRDSLRAEAEAESGLRARRDAHVRAAKRLTEEALDAQLDCEAAHANTMSLAEERNRLLAAGAAVEHEVHEMGARLRYCSDYLALQQSEAGRLDAARREAAEKLHQARAEALREQSARYTADLKARLGCKRGG